MSLPWRVQVGLRATAWLYCRGRKSCTTLSLRIPTGITVDEGPEAVQDFLLQEHLHLHEAMVVFRVEGGSIWASAGGRDVIGVVV